MNYKIKLFRIAVRFLGNAKIDLYELAELFKSLDYSVKQLPPRRFRALIGGSGQIAVKGHIAIDVNTDKLIIGVSSPDPEECINEFTTIENAIATRFDSLRKPYFYELLVELEIESTKAEPIELIQNLSGENIIAQKLSEALREPLLPFGYRLARKGSSPENIEWIDLEIIPYIIKPHSSIYVTMVYRSAKREKVLEKGMNLEAIVDAINDLVRGVEAGGR